MLIRWWFFQKLALGFSHKTVNRFHKFFLDSSTDQEFNDFVGSSVTNQNGDLFGGLEIELGIFVWDFIFDLINNQISFMFIL